MDYLNRRLIRWDLLREKMNNRPSFTDGTTIRSSSATSIFPCNFSRSPIECDVSSLSLDEILIYLLHTLSYYLRKKKSDPSDMAKFSHLFDFIFIKVLKEPDMIVKDEESIMLANLFITIEECCTKLITPANLIVENDDLKMDKLSQNVRDIMNLIEKHSSDVISKKILRAATHNLINRFEERSELISQLKDWRFKDRIIQEKNPEYSAESKVFTNARENLFNRTYFAITIHSNGLAAISRSKIYFQPTLALLRLTTPEGPKIIFTNDDDENTLATYKLSDGMRKLFEFCSEYTTLEGNHAEYYKILKTFSSDFWRRRLRIEQIMRSNRYFSSEEMFIIFHHLWAFIKITNRMLYYRDGDVVLIKKYMKIFYRIWNSLSLSKILPLITLSLVAIVTSDIHTLYELPEAEPVRQEAVKLLMIHSKLMYFYAPETELSKCIQTYMYHSLDQTEYFMIKMIPMFRTPKDFSEVERKLWRGFMSRRKFSGRDDVLKQNNGECIVCTDKFIGDNFFILSCCHAVCEDCLQLLMKESHQRYVSLHL